MKIGRNSPCPCGSGQKYKRCCIDKPAGPTSANAGQRNRSLSAQDLVAGTNVSWDELFSDSARKFAATTLRLIKVPFVRIAQDESRRLYINFTDGYNPNWYQSGRQPVYSIELDEKGRIFTDLGSESSYLAFCYLQALLSDNLSNKDFKSSENFMLFRNVLQSLFGNNKETKIDLAAIHIIPSFGNDLEACRADFVKLKASKTFAAKKGLFRRNKLISDGLPVFDGDLIEVESVQNSRLAGLVQEIDYDNWSDYAPEDILRHIEYRFSDGLIVSGCDILHHPYTGLLLKQECFIGSTQNPRSHGNAPVTPWVDLGIFNFGAAFELQKTVNVWIDSVIKSAKNNSVDIYLAFRNDCGIERDSIKLSDFKNVSRSHQSVKIENAADVDRPLSNSLKLVTKTNSTWEDFDTRINEGWKLNKNKNLVVYDDFYKIEKKIPAPFKPFPTPAGMNSRFHQEFIAYESELKENDRESLELDLIGRGFENVSKEPNKKITDFKLQAQCNFSQNNEDFKFSFFVWSKDFQFQSCLLSPVLSLALSSINVGFKGNFNSIESIVCDKSHPLRKNDLKFCRHGGMYAYVLRSVLEFMMTHSGSVTVGQIQQLQKEILEKIHLLAKSDSMAKGLDSANPRLNQIISNTLIQSLRTWIQDFVESDELRVYEFVYLGKPSEVNICTEVYQSILFLVDELIAENKNTFSKAKLKWWIGIMPNSSSLGSAPNLIERSNPSLGAEVFSDCAKSVLLKNRSPLIEYFIDGERITEISEDEIISKYSLEERQEDSMDWFDLNPKIFFKGKELSREQCREFSSNSLVEFEGKKYFIDQKSIPSLKWLSYFWDRLQEVGTKKGATARRESYLKVPRSQILDLLALRQAGIPVIGGERWNLICKEFDQLKEGSGNRVERLLPSKLVEILKPFQMEGVERIYGLYKLGLGGVLADDMGLGKTLQALSFLELLRNQKKLKNNLIVLPTSLIYNWVAEIKKFTPDLPYEVFSSKEREIYAKTWDMTSPKIVIVTYGLLSEHSEFFKKWNWQTIIFDEAQNIKNISAARTTAAREQRAESKFCLTGTPMENHFGEFFSILDLSLPGCLGSYKKFMSIYSFKAGKTAVSTSYTAKDIEFLKLKSQPLVLRRKKEKVLADLPEKTETVVSLPFEKQQEKIYRDIAISWNEKVREKIQNPKSKNGGNAQLEMLTALLRLRQACSCPQILPNIKYNKKSPKLALIIDSMSDLLLTGESALVFTNFLSTLEIIKDHLEASGINCLTMVGKTPAKKRQQILEEFNSSPLPQVLLMTLKTGGVGLNLTKANYVFHFEPWWNPAAENQGTDRVHRMGQKKNVHVFRYIIKNSVEEKIETLKGHKHLAFASLFEEDEKYLDDLSPAFSKTGLSRSDFEYLLN